jgi:chromosome segregation ATPase
LNPADPTEEAEEFEEVEERKKRKLSTKKNIKSPPRKRREIPPKLELTEEIIEEFNELEKSIRRLERRGMVEKFEAKSTEIDELRRTLTQMEATQKELKKGTEKARADLENLAQPGLKIMLRRLGTMDERMENGRKQFEEAIFLN